MRIEDAEQAPPNTATQPAQRGPSLSLSLSLSPTAQTQGSTLTLGARVGCVDHRHIDRIEGVRVVGVDGGDGPLGDAINHCSTRGQESGDIENIT